MALPWLFVPQDSVDNDEELASGGDGGDPLWLSCVDESFAEGFQDWITAASGESGEPGEAGDLLVVEGSSKGVTKKFRGPFSFGGGGPPAPVQKTRPK